MKAQLQSTAALLMVLRDEKLQQAQDLLAAGQARYDQVKEQTDRLLSDAKKDLHIARIESNRLKKVAATIQTQISAELEVQVLDEQEVLKTWEPKSLAHMAAIYQSQNQEEG